MKEALERIDSAALFLHWASATWRCGRRARTARRFERELEAQEHNITEAGEAEATVALAQGWKEYLALYDQLSGFTGIATRRRPQPDPTDIKRFYFAELEPSSSRSRTPPISSSPSTRTRWCARATRRAARRRALDGSCCSPRPLALVLGIVISADADRPGSCARSSVLAQAVAAPRRGRSRGARAGAGQRRDRLARARVQPDGRSARQYRQSSLGELLQAQRASQAAIDSLPDPVVIFDPRGACCRATRRRAGCCASSPQGSLQPLAQADPAVRDVRRAHADPRPGRQGRVPPKGLEEALRSRPPRASAPAAARHAGARRG